jgi:hypothetical protein
MRLLVALFLCVCLPSPLIAKSDAWLLMRPPEGGTTEPVSSWHRVRSYESAEECAIDKLALRELILDRAMDAPEIYGATWDYILDAAYSVRCISTESYRKPEQPSPPSNLKPI